MRNITRRLTAAVLSACLALSPAGVLAEQPMDQQMTAQVELPMSDGTSMLLPVQTVITSTGETVYWLDMSPLSEEQIEALAMAQMMLYDEAGEVLGQYLFSELEDGVIELYDAIDPEVTVPMMLAPLALPESIEEIESVLAEYGFMDGGYDEEADWAEQERIAAEQAARAEAERIAAEQAEQERIAAEQAELERKAEEEAARKAEEEAALKAEQERLAAEQAELERKAAEEAALKAAEEEAARKAAEEAALKAAEEEAARKAAEESALKAEQERLAAEQAEQERIAAEQAELERLAAEQAELERLAAEQAQQQEQAEQQTPDFEEIIQNIVVPAYVFPYYDNTNLRSEPIKDADNVLTQVNINDILIVSGHAVDGEGNVWWQATDYRTGVFGFIMADVTSQLEEEHFIASAQIIDAEKAAEAERLAAEAAQKAEDERIAVEAAAAAQKAEEERIAAEAAAAAQKAEEERIAAEAAAAAQKAEEERIAAEAAAAAQKAEEERIAAEAAAAAQKAEEERIAAEAAAAAQKAEEERIAAEAAAAAQKAEEERIAAEAAAKLEQERIAAEAAAKAEAERIAAEQAEQQKQQEQTEQQETAVRYAITSNRNGDNPINNLRAEADSGSDVVGVYENGELLIWGDPTSDGKWYPVTVVRDGAQGYMRDYLLTEISEADAQVRMAEILAAKAEENQPQEDDNYPELIVPEQTQDQTEGKITDNPSEETENETVDESIDETVDEIIDETIDETVDETIDETIDETGNEGSAELIVPEQPEEIPDSPTVAFPAYAMTLAQENNAAIVLREEPAGPMPQRNEIPMINSPTPLEITEEKLDSQGGSWYLVRNMNNGDTGYIEAYKVELVDQETAEANIVPETDVLPPVPSDNENTQPEETEPDENDGEGEDTSNETEIIEPEIPDTPQELTEGDIYHYGRNTGRQVGLRKAPGKDRIYNMEKGTILWVMSREGDWCHVRTDRAEGYVMAEYVELMNVREEAEYIASIDDPEVAPEKSEPETVEPEETDPNYPELIVPDATVQPEETDPNYPELIVPEKTEEPTPEPTAEPTPTPKKEDAKPTATPAPQEIERYAVVTVDNTQLRSNPTMNAYLQCEIAEGGVVYAMRTEMNDDGEIWTLVQLETEWGYVLSDNIRLMSDEEQENYLAALEAAQATPTPTVEPTTTPEPTATPAPQRLEFYARVINDGTPLRGNPDPNAYLQTILDKETVVFLFQSQIAADGMTWYLVQHSGQWGYIRADLVRPMGEQETADYLAQLEAELATPTPMPQVTPEPIGPDSTSAYAKLIKDKVNLRRTPSSSGTSLDRVPIGELLLVLGSEYDGTYTWYQVTYDSNEGYIRSDMAQMLTIAELEAHFQEQMEQAQQSKPGVSATPNKNNNTDIVINGSQLQDLIPVDNSWTNNVISGMPLYATATPDPNTTPTPQPPEKSAALIRSSGDITVNNVPALTREASFSVYGKTKAYTTVTATVEMAEQQTNTLPSTIGMNLVSTAIAENIVKRTVGQAVSDANGLFEMTVTLPDIGEYIVEFASAEGAFAQYGVTYDTGATPLPTAAPLPTAMPVEEEDGGMGVLPFVIGGLMIVIAAAVYGVYVYRRKSEEDEEDEEDEDEETEMRQAQLNMQRQRAASSAAPAAPKKTTSTVIPSPQRMPKTPGASSSEIPSYMKNAQKSPYARPQAPVMPKAPAAPQAPVAPQAPAAPKAPVVPQAPAAPKAPVAPQAPVTPKAPSDVTVDVTSTPRRRRPPADPNA